MKNQKGFILPIVIVVAVVALFGTAGYFGYQYYSKTQEQPKPIACTQDAKLCPNGSYVSRTGPNCEFAECPAVADQAAGLPVQNKQATEGWETYRNDEYGFEIKYPTDAKIKEVDKSISLVFADNQRKLNIEVIKNAESNECYKTAWAAELPDI
ncbi:MAG: hypothetical protein HYT35_01455, partial [Candidatus Staskawiczbacteria bacterium]|nr:hypothetical protein [Candidatus Staskawiczbacteria bacterium]